MTNFQAKAEEVKEMIQVNESNLDRTDRLGLAWCRLNRFKWDDIAGPKPEGFEDLPAVAPKRRFWLKKQPCKRDFIRPAMKAIESIIGEANTSRCWWLFDLGKTEGEWLQWYLTGCIKEDS